MTVEIISLSISTKVSNWAGIELTTTGSADGFATDRYRNTIRVSNSLIPDQVLICVQTVCKGFQPTTKVTRSKERANP